MAAVALTQLGAPAAVAEQWLLDYQRKLEPLAAAPQGYAAARREFLLALGRDGLDATLARHLPGLASGWARDAFHPLIRLAFGFEQRCAAEVASGLAYLALCGPDQRIATLARSARTAAAPEALIAAATPLARTADAARTFTERLDTVVQTPAFATCALVFADNDAQVSRLMLDVFAGSHDFFALHLVTGAHAFRVLAQHMGPDSGAVFNLGLAAAYAAAGAPALRTTSPPHAVPDDWLALTGEDEHDAKLAYSATCQATYFQDSAYMGVAADYLRERRSRS